MEDSGLSIEVIDEADSTEDPDDYKKLGEILLEKRDISRKDLDSVLGDKKLLGEALIDKGLVQSERVQAALTEQEHMRQIQGKQAQDRGDLQYQGLF